MKALIFLAIFLWLPFGIQANDTARVARVIDGDTFVTEDSVHVRILGIDCPEAGDTVGNHEYIRSIGTIFVILMTAGKDVDLIYDRDRRDRYGRTLAIVMVGNEDLGAAMVSYGLAKVYRGKFFSYLQEYKKLEVYARYHKRGLWAE